MTERPKVTDDMVRAFAEGVTSTPPRRPLPTVVVPPPAPRFPGKPSAKARTEGRTCGSCDACCTVLGIEVLEKDAGSRCPHLRAKGGCGIYTTRPGECAIYRCLWHTGVFGETRDRPDRLGLILDAPQPMAEMYLYKDIPFVVVREVWPGAAWSPRASRVISPIAAHMVVVVQAFNTNVERMLGPRSMVEEVKRRALAGPPAQEVSDGR